MPGSAQGEDGGPRPGGGAWKPGRRWRLARRVFAFQASQPATALWRTPEAEVVVENLRGAGRGLDLACGDGTLAQVLLEHLPAVDWLGLDLDVTDVAAARAAGPYRAVGAADAARLPLADGSLDLVFSNSALEHMDGLERVLDETARVLRPGGRFAFTVPTSSFHDNLLWRRLLAGVGLSRAARRYTAHLDRRLMHRNYLCPEAWHRALERAGFVIERTVPYLSRRETALWELAANATGGVAYLLSGGRPPRQVQHALGIDTVTGGFVGRLVFWLFSPLVLAAAVERRPRRFSALYVEARRRA